MSHLATWQGKPRVGIDHAIAAQGWAKHSGDLLLQAYASDVAARAFALDGQRSACLTELDTAGRAVSAAPPGRSPLVYFYGPGQFAYTRSVCLLDPEDAGQLMARNRSARLTRRPRAGRSQVAQWQSAKAVRALDERLTAYGLA